MLKFEKIKEMELRNFPRKIQTKIQNLKRQQQAKQKN